VARIVCCCGADSSAAWTSAPGHATRVYPLFLAQTDGVTANELLSTRDSTPVAYIHDRSRPSSTTRDYYIGFRFQCYSWTRHALLQWVRGSIGSTLRSAILDISSTQSRTRTDEALSRPCMLSTCFPRAYLRARTKSRRSASTTSNNAFAKGGDRAESPCKA
jgi:hypothetical protein